MTGSRRLIWPTDPSWGSSLDYGPVFLRKPFRFHLAVGTLPSGSSLDVAPTKVLGLVDIYVSSNRALTA